MIDALIFSYSIVQVIMAFQILIDDNKGLGLGRQ